MYLQKIKALDARREEFKQALRTRSQRLLEKETEEWHANAKELDENVHFLEWQKENDAKIGANRKYKQAKDVLVRHYRPCTCGPSCTCCASKRCYFTVSQLCGWVYNATWYNYCRSKIYERNVEIRRAEKLLTSWKKEEALEGKIILSLIYKEIVAGNERFTLRRRKKWVEKHFLPEGEPPIVTSAVMRGKEAWEDKLEKDEQTKRDQQSVWQLEGDENHLFGQFLSAEEKEMWGLESSDSEEDSESSEEEEEEEEGEGEEEEEGEG